MEAKRLTHILACATALGALLFGAVACGGGSDSGGGGDGDNNGTTAGTETSTTSSESSASATAATGASSATAPAGSQTVVPVAAGNDTLDGTYTIALPPGAEVCGLPSIHGLTLAIHGDAATLSSSTGELLHGSALRTGQGISVQLGGAQGREWGVDLSGDLDESGSIQGLSKSGGVNPGGQTGFSCNYPFTAHPTVATTAPPAAPGAVPSAGADADALRAAILDHNPEVAFDPGCSVDTPKGPCATGAWSAEILASGIAAVSVHSDQDGIGTWYGRKADGTWVYWFATQNSGGPLTSLPGDMIVCADGDGLNLRAEPSSSASVVALIPDGTTVRGDRFVMTDAPTPGGTVQPHPDGWYHITSPHDGWAYDRYLLGYANGVTTCIKTWWP